MTLSLQNHSASGRSIWSCPSWILLFLCLVTTPFGEAFGINKVEVESKIVLPGSAGVKLDVYITNDVPITDIFLPLEIRSLDYGSFTAAPLTLAMNPSGRIYPSPIGDPGIGFSFRYGYRTGQCFDGASNMDYATPDAVMIYAGSASPPPNNYLAAGADAPGNPSFQLTFNVTLGEGSFEIDTCCITPDQRIQFILATTGNPITPIFYPGEVTIFDDDLAHWPNCGCDVPPLGDEELITSPYGPRWIYRTTVNPPQYDTDYHDGLDLRNAKDDPVYASTSGTIKQIVHDDNSNDYGWYINVLSRSRDVGQNLRGHYADYQHLKFPTLQVEMPIAKDAIIGYSDGPPNIALAAHIHFEIQYDPASFHGSNPLHYLQRSDDACPEFLVPPTIDGTDRLTGTIISWRTEQLDLNRISVWVYVSGLQGREALVDFEDQSQMESWEGSYTDEDGQIRFFPGEPHEVLVTLVPHELFSSPVPRISFITS